MSPHLDTAVAQHMTHAAGSLADCGTESLYEQALLPTQPAGLDDPTLPDSGIPSDLTQLLIAAAGVAAAIFTSWLLPLGWF